MFLATGKMASTQKLYILPEGCNPSFAINEGSSFAALEIDVIKT
jgi:hypothetical protein